MTTEKVQRFIARKRIKPVETLVKIIVQNLNRGICSVI